MKEAMMAILGLLTVIMWVVYVAILMSGNGYPQKREVMKVTFGLTLVTMVYALVMGA